VADAEIIPLGTRGRPGRGSGSAKPSASARNLAGTAKKAQRKPAPGPDTAPETAPAGPTTAPTVPEARRPREDAERSRPAAAPSSAADRTRTGAPRGKRPATGPTAPPAEAGAAEAADAGDRAGSDAAGGDLAAPAVPTTSSTTTRERPAADGIPVGDWVEAFSTAAREIFGEEWERRLAELLAFLRRRVTGDYAIDEYGFDREVTERFFYAAIRPIAEKWFRVEVRGADNIPTEGGALVVSNHSGTIPMDGLVTGVSIHDHTGRHLRPLGADLVFRLPIVGEIARKGGATLACNEDAERMLRGGELVGVWPEGFKGIGKPYSERYKLQRFGRGGFVSAALRTGVPIIPCSVVGAEEIYPLVGNVPSLARLLGVPYIPITPFFPLLGPLGLVPLPSKWLIEFGEPIRTDSYEEGAADDPMLVFNVTDQVRETIQQTLYSLLMQRRSVFS
jgi:1-acyl-sn-glycerol-3-phosphate acyltransferase